MTKVVLDTNIILSSVFTSSPYHRILSDFFNHKYTLIVTTDILLEYEEKIAENFGEDVALSIVDSILQNSLLKRISVFFNLGLIKADPDDNKFVDAAFAANADFIVTNDRHFNILKKINFPSIKVIDIDTFLKILSQQ